MGFNPFEQTATSPECFYDWKGLYPYSYNKYEVDPYTRCRVILMNGTEVEAALFSHNFFRNCPNNDLRRDLALTRRTEQQQQKRIQTLKPVNETPLEATIGYEQLAVDLTAGMAEMEPDCYVKAAMDLALLEDFDHLYRYANLFEMDQGERAERLVGCYTEIMPGRPTISEHRYPKDSVRRFTDFTTAHPLTKLHTQIITAAEQQTMNYYMNVCALYPNDLGRRLYQEIGMIEEQHVSQYGSLIDTRMTWLENLLMHEYTECYLYYSCYMDETDPHIRKVWEQHLYQEIGHLQKAAELLQKYEGKCWQQLIPCGDFPELLRLHPNKEYIRDVLRNTVCNTAVREDYAPVQTLPLNADFCLYQKQVNSSTACEPSHQTIEKHIMQMGKDYRYQEAPHPIPALDCRTRDNTCVGREAPCLAQCCQA